MSALENYRAALFRLIEGKPHNVPKGSAINKDTVALEAGRKRGSIKKSREEHAGLIKSIEAASTAQQQKSKRPFTHDAEKQKALKKAAQEQFETIKEDYHLALTKIVSLVHENHILKERIKEFAQAKERTNKIFAMERPTKV
ncbi:hypothetical protein G7025_10315 [Pseudomonas lurida]|uniref:hypothetical protein n=1 Tax=Pseudomonas lurida TaxID=244566 RepID=UPI0015E447DD|nr:hypothetical protein [Pseudomonas lurida]MBA1293752.1 hypothetical protein [Pseudomonas lurida]